MTGYGITISQLPAMIYFISRHRSMGIQVFYTQVNVIANDTAISADDPVHVVMSADINMAPYLLLCTFLIAVLGAYTFYVGEHDDYHTLPYEVRTVHCCCQIRSVGQMI